MEKKTKKFLLQYKINNANGRAELRLTSARGGKNYSVHTHYNLLAEDGTRIKRSPITFEVAQFIFNNFDRRGDTLSFEIYYSDLVSSSLLKKENEIKSDDIRHKVTSTEHSFTATGEKLAYHAPIFEKYRDTGYASIIRATMTLHQICASSCQYCSTILRNRADSISLEEAKRFVIDLYDVQARFNKTEFTEYNDSYKERTGSDIRLRGLILSGGGQPNLWPHFQEFVEWLSNMNIDLGLITNGFPSNIPDEIYKFFKWIRISITPDNASPHYPDGQFDQQYLPSTIVDNSDMTVGYSYVYGPWTTAKKLLQINKAITKNGMDYCRVLTDCNLTRAAQLRAHKELAEQLFKLGLIDEKGTPLHRIFHQLKYHGTQRAANQLWEKGQCYLQIYNVFWDTTGHEKDGYSHCYPCDSVTVLAEEAADKIVKVSERRFNPKKWGLVVNKEVSRLFTEPVKPTFDPRKICSACLFMRNNQTVKNMSSPGFKSKTLDSSIEHINFP